MSRLCRGRRRFGGSGLRLGGGFRLRGSGRLRDGGRDGFDADAENAGADLVGYFIFDRTRVGLFFRDAKLGQHFENDARFDFQLAGQFVDADLTHVRHAALPRRTGHQLLASPRSSSLSGWLLFR
jgi:hypothetical protein